MPKSTFYNLPYEKRKKIIEGAKKAFSQKHYNKVTINSIIQYAQIPKGSFYQYFDNKDDLFKHIFQDIGIDKKNQLIDEINKSHNLKFSDLMIRVIARSNQFETRDKTLIDLKDRFLKECPQELKNEILFKLMPKTMDLFHSIISIYMKTGEFRDDFNIKTAAFILTSTVLNIDKYNLEKENNHGEVFKNVCDLLEIGMRKS